VAMRDILSLDENSEEYDELLENYEENIDQVKQRISETKEMIEKNRENWEETRDSQSGRTVFEFLRLLKTILMSGLRKAAR